MARSFLTVNTEYFINTGTPPVVNLPLSLACWFKVTATSGNESFIHLWDNSGDLRGFRLWKVNGGNLRATSHQASDISASTSVLVTPGQWQHGLAVFASTTSRTIYLDGGNAVTSTASSTPGNATRTLLAARGRGTADHATNGDLAEWAVWNVALSADDAVTLARGVAPPLVQPDALRFYVQGHQDSGDEFDLRSGLVMTDTNTVTAADHPRIFYPSSTRIRTTGAAKITRQAMHHYRLRRAG